MIAGPTASDSPQPLARHSFAAMSGYAAAPLEDVLTALCAYGKPRLCRMPDGWYCVIEMHVAAAGTEFTVKSEFTCQTPIIAARQCAERVVATLKQYAA